MQTIKESQQALSHVDAVYSDGTPIPDDAIVVDTLEYANPLKNDVIPPNQTMNFYV